MKTGLDYFSAKAKLKIAYQLLKFPEKWLKFSGHKTENAYSFAVFNEFFTLGFKKIAADLLTGVQRFMEMTC